MKSLLEPLLHESDASRYANESESIKAVECEIVTDTGSLALTDRTPPRREDSRRVSLAEIQRRSPVNSDPSLHSRDWKWSPSYFDLCDGGKNVV